MIWTACTNNSLTVSNYEDPGCRCVAWEPHEVFSFRVQVNDKIYIKLRATVVIWTACTSSALTVSNYEDPGCRCIAWEPHEVFSFRVQVNDSARQHRHEDARAKAGDMNKWKSEVLANMLCKSWKAISSLKHQCPHGKHQRPLQTYLVAATSPPSRKITSMLLHHYFLYA